MKHTHKLTFYCSRTVSDPKNCVYPYKVAVDTEEDLRTVVRYDHVFAKYTGNRRSNDNFEYADLLVLDCDNDHSDAREAWIWPDDLSDLMPGVSYFTYSSRSDNLPKGELSSRSTGLRLRKNMPPSSRKQRSSSPSSTATHWMQAGSSSARMLPR